jgi:hypothetical protein
MESPVTAGRTMHEMPERGRGDGRAAWQQEGLGSGTYFPVRREVSSS